MKTDFNRHFLKDVGKLPTAELKNEVAAIILAVEAATSFSEIQNVKKLKGFKTAYRIRVGDFRAVPRLVYAGCRDAIFCVLRQVALLSNVRRKILRLYAVQRLYTNLAIALELASWSLNKQLNLCG